MERAKLVVIGGGPGGYAAAFRAADLGVEVTLVDAEAQLGGVCLLRGCIPSKALLHAARVISEAREAERFGVRFAAPEIDLERLRAWKGEVVDRLAQGVAQLAKRRGVRVLRAFASVPRRRHPRAGRGRRAPGASASTTRSSRPARSRSSHLPCGRTTSASWIRPRPSTCRSPAPPPGRGRRLRRPRAGHRLRGARRQGHGRRDDRRSPARRGPRPRARRSRSASSGSSRPTTRARGSPGSRRRTPACAPISRALASIHRSSSTGCWWRSAASPGPMGWASRAAGVELDEKGFVRVDRRRRTHRAPHPGHRRRGRRAHAGPQGGPGGQGGGRGRRRRAGRVRQPGDPRGGLHRPRGRLVRAHRDPGRGGGSQGRGAALPMVRVRTGAHARAHGGPHQAHRRRRDGTGARRGRGRARARESSSRRARWPWSCR